MQLTKSVEAQLLGSGKISLATSPDDELGDAKPADLNIVGWILLSTEKPSSSTVVNTFTISASLDDPATDQKVWATNITIKKSYEILPECPKKKAPPERK